MNPAVTHPGTGSSSGRRTVPPRPIVSRYQTARTARDFTAVLAGVLALVLYSYVGTFVLGVFIYYAARPIYRWVRLVVGRPGLAALGSLLAFELPFLAVTGHVLLLAVRGLERYAGTGADFIARFLPVRPTEVERVLADPVASVAALDASRISRVAFGTVTPVSPRTLRSREA